jgi:hypothetical protein
MNYVLFYLYIKKTYSLILSFVEFFPPLQTANVTYFPRKLQLSGLSANPKASPSQMLRISRVLLYLYLQLQAVQKILLLDKGTKLIRNVDNYLPIGTA